MTDRAENGLIATGSESVPPSVAPTLSGNNLLSIVVCFYNEAAGIDAFFSRLMPGLAALDKLHLEIICVNDGSRDATLALLLLHAKADDRIKVIDLSRNFGKEAALTAGLDAARGDAAVPIDADLQAPPDLIPRMVELWRQGYDVVLARRIDRSKDAFLKRVTARLFYRLHHRIASIDVPNDVGDFRLMDRRVLLALRKLPENHRYMKGIFAWVGFRSTTIDYVRAPRRAGHSKLPMARLWALAIEGITSFSTVPLRIWTYIGMTISTLAFLYIMLVIVLVLSHQMPFSGYATIVVAIMGLGGIQLIGIGVLGEYIGRIYTEAKRRPVYLVRETYNMEAAPETPPAHPAKPEEAVDPRQIHGS
ncbi:MAG TPA: glycosyltransferase family 2 protein [Dongiaceae bacterium]|nr:glycosyltransferase family 2 protein [Dongiaceae bacterium]